MIDKRPWCNSKVAEESETNPYAEFSAWESWLYESLDELLPEGEEGISDNLTVTQKAYLFNLMARLADGEFIK